MKKIALLLSVLLIVGAVGTYFYFSGKVYTIKLTETQLQEKLQKKMPINKTVLFIVQITLDNPRVQLVDGSNRINAGLDVILNITVDKQPLPLGGSVDVSGGITYNSKTAKFFLTDPIIENLKVQGLPSKHTNKANKALSKVLTKFYKDNPVYTLRATDAKKAAAKLVLKTVKIENQELVVTLGI